MNIIGHQKVLKILEKTIEKNAVAGAYLFSGPEHTGKFTVAFDFAKRLVGETEGLNTEIFIAEPEVVEKNKARKKLDIKIEKIKELQRYLSLSSTGKYRVAIIDDANRMNKNAQNALLKTLEEAEAGITVIMVSQDDRKILPTIVSRSQKIKFGTVGREALEEHIPEGQENKESILSWSLGRPGFLMNLVNNKEDVAFRQESFLELKNLFDQNSADKFILAEKMSKDGEAAKQKINLWIIFLRDRLFFRNYRPDIPSQKIFNLIEAAEKSLALIRETNANVRLILENLFLEF